MDTFKININEERESITFVFCEEGKAPEGIRETQFKAKIFSGFRVNLLSQAAAGVFDNRKRRRRRLFGSLRAEFWLSNW